jgi:hypothetical protein
MRAFYRWIAGCSLVVPMFAACSSAQSGLSGGSSGLGGDDDSGGAGLSSGGGNSSGSGFGYSSGSASSDQNAGPCKGGQYAGTFAGFYNSHLTFIGVPIPVTGNVQLQLDQAGAAGTTCVVLGENESCSNVFTLKDGTITGVADSVMTDAGTIGGFPYFCTMTGTLDCEAKKLDDGWIECTYCVGPLADGGGACAVGNGLFGSTGVGGHFAGPLVANYDYTQLAFVDGTWNGAEALCTPQGVCNDGGSPGPEGGPVTNYLADGGLYAGPTDFGGSGTWNATHQ